MRPAKHVHLQMRAQEIFDISVARLITKEKVVPIAATSESGNITLFVWDDADGGWRSADIGHAPIEAPRGVPSITNTWNWSRRVGLVTFDETICVVYKRAEIVPEEETQKPAALMLETYRLDSGNALVRELRISVPMPMFTVPTIFPPGLDRIAEKPGFELWAGVDLVKRRLLIVTQTLGRDATENGEGAQLKLLVGELDRLDDETAWNFHGLDSGGYGLDVRNQGDSLVLAYRQTAHSLRVPLPISGLDPFFAGWPRAELDAQATSDQFYDPLRVMFLDLETLTRETLELPGGEHARIQNVDPLFIVVDRPQATMRFRVVRNAEGNNEPRIDWLLRGVDKLAFLLDDSQRVARGVLMPFLEGDRLTFPRTGTPWIDAQDLFTDITINGVGWASTKSRFPIEPLRVDSDEKGLFFDFLHKAPLFALLESRVRLNASFEEGVLNAADLQSVVYDINHGQFNAPDTLRPDATGENAQFAPFERLSQQSGNVLTAPSYFSDNTIGGSLVTDRDGIPYQFFSYIDLGDGGLRVIYDADLGPPDAPPPNEKPKTLEPERVPGPGSEDERWIELKTDDWQDAGVPSIMLTDLLVQPTVTSAVHSQLESLLEVGPDAGFGVDEENGWTETDVNEIQTAVNDQIVNLGAEPDVIFSTDQTIPRAFISILPPTVLAEAGTTWEAGLEDGTEVSVAWRFTLPLVNLPPIVVTVAGNHAKVALPSGGEWTVRATITLDDDTVRTFETVVSVADSLFRQMSSIHRKLADTDLGPLNTLGTFKIGTATFKFLQYELQFPVAAAESLTHKIIIKSLDKTDAEWQFLANGTEQGVIDYRLRISFASKDIRLGGLLNSLLKVESIKASFFYGRRFTPGILMNDTRSALPRTDADSSFDNLNHHITRRLASSITARPFGDDATTKDSVKVKVSMLPQALAASVVILLVGLGAVTAVATLTALIAALNVAIAAAAAPIIGVGGAAAVVAAAIAIFLFITFVVPPIVENAIEDSIERGLTNEESRKSLADSRFLQFAGEGIAEAISRQIIGPIADGAQLEPPPNDKAQIGEDRFRQDLFQMIHVSNGRARVLIRA